MGIRTTNLDISDLTIGATQYPRRTEGVTVATRIMTADAHGAAWRHAHKQPVQRDIVLTVPMFVYLSSFPRTNIDLSAFSIDGDAFLADVDSFEISVTTEVDAAHGLNDYDAFPVPTGTTVTGRATIFATPNSDILAIINGVKGGAPDDAAVAIAVAAGAATFAMPMVIQDVTHRAQRSAIQMYDLSLEPQAIFASGYGITQDFSAIPLLQNIMTQSAFVSPITFTTVDGLEYEGEGILTSGSFAVSKRGLIRDAFEITLQGGEQVLAGSA